MGNPASSKGLWLGFLGVVIFSLSLPATRVAVAELGADFVTAVRLSGAGALATFLLIVQRSPRPSWAQWQLLAWVIAGVVIGFPLFSALAMRHVDASHGGVVLAALPLLTAIAGAYFAGERPSVGFWMCAVGGALTVLVFVLTRSEGAAAMADIYLLAAAILAAIGYASGGLLARSMPGLTVIAWALAASLPLALPFLWLTWPANITQTSTAAWIAQGYVAVGAQFLGFYFFYKGLAIGGIARVGQVQLMQVYLTMGFGALLLGEHIDLVMLAAALITVSFVWLSRQMVIKT